MFLFLSASESSDCMALYKLFYLLTYLLIYLLTYLNLLHFAACHSVLAMKHHTPCFRYVSNCIFRDLVSEELELLVSEELELECMMKLLRVLISL